MFELAYIVLKELCLNYLSTNPKKPSVSIALISINYKIVI